jgi:PAS domain S-box-containing protein
LQRRTSQLLFAIAAAAVLLTVLIGWLYVDRNLARRLRLIIDGATAIAGGDYDVTLPSVRDDELGEMTTALSVFRDRSRQVVEANRRAMETARRRMTEVVESISDGFALYDRDGRVQVFNRRWRQLVGLQDTDPRGMTLQAILERGVEHIDVGDYGSNEEWIRQRLARRPGDNESFVVHFKDGRWIDVRQFPTHDGSVVVTYTDVTTLKERELALAEANRQSKQLAQELDVILETIEFGVLIVDPDLIIKRSNRKYREIWKTPKEFLDTHPTLYEDMEWERRNGIIDIPDDEWDHYVAERVSLIMAAGITPPIETTLADGTTLRRQAVPLPSGDRMITYYDVTDLTRREAQLAQAIAEKDAVLAEFEAVLESIDYGIAFADSDLRVRIANRTFRELWNIPKELTDQRPTLRHLIEYSRESDMLDIDDESWPGYVEERLAKIRAGDIAATEIPRSDGRSVLYRCVALPDGVRMLTYFDITPMKQAQAALRESEERYALAMQGAQEGMWDWRAADNRVFISQRFREIVGLDEQTEWLDPAAWEALVHPDDLALHKHAMREHLRGKTHQFDVEYRILVKDRGERWVRNRGIGIRDEHGKVHRMAGSLGSIDERKKAELELIGAKEQAEQANRVKSQFLANISHELRTPLNAVIGITEMTLEDIEKAGDERYEEPLGRVLRAGKHLLKLITELLDLSRIEAGRMELVMENVHIATLVADAVATAQPIAEANRNRIETDVDNDVGRVTADPTRLRQILLNLLSNACKFTESGVITVRVSREAFVDGDRLAITVADSGIGMDTDVLERVFDEFIQADSSLSRRHGGTGLGLTISRKLAHLMGGDIQVSSTLGVGSSFTLTLPARVTEPGYGDTGAAARLHRSKQG